MFIKYSQNTLAKYTPYCGIINACTQHIQFAKGGLLMSNKKETSKHVASTASKVLRDNRYSKASKTCAGSALVQTKKK